MFKKSEMLLLLGCFFLDSFSMKRMRNQSDIVLLVGKKPRHSIDLYDKLSRNELTSTLMLSANFDSNQKNQKGIPIIINVLSKIDALTGIRNNNISALDNHTIPHYVFTRHGNTSKFTLKKNDSENPITKLNEDINGLLKVARLIVSHQDFIPSFCLENGDYLPHFLVKRALMSVKGGIKQELSPDKRKKWFLLLNEQKQEEYSLIETMLLHPKCPLKHHNNEGKMALHIIAARFSDQDIARTIMQECMANKTTQDYLLKIADYLLMPRDVNVSDLSAEGESALHYACMNNDPWMFLLLSSCNNVVRVLNKSGQEPGLYNSIMKKYLLNEHAWKKTNGILDKENYCTKNNTDYARSQNIIKSFSLTNSFYADLAIFFGFNSPVQES